MFFFLFVLSIELGFGSRGPLRKEGSFLNDSRTHLVVSPSLIRASSFFWRFDFLEFSSPITFLFWVLDLCSWILVSFPLCVGFTDYLCPVFSHLYPPIPSRPSLISAPNRRPTTLFTRTES